MAGPTVRTFTEARKLHNPPRLITFCEFDTGAGRATVNGFESRWRSVPSLGSASVVTSTTKNEGNFSNKVTWTTSNALSVIATTIPALDLSALETVRFFVRSTVTMAPMRLGLGEASAGEFLPEIASIVTANTFVERQVSIDSLLPGSRNAITKLRFEIYGKGGAAATAITYFDNMYAIRRSRYANIFTAKPGVIISSDEVDVEISGSGSIITDGHAMDNLTAMDDTSSMTDGVTLVPGGTITNPVDLSGQNTLQISFESSAVPATLRFGFGEATSTEKTFLFTLATASVSLLRTFDISTMPAANRNAVQFFSLTPISVPTSQENYICSMDTLIASRYFNPSPIVPYRVFKEKLVGVSPINHSIGHVQDQARIANTSLRIANHDSEFYSLRENNNFINRNVNVFLGWENQGDNESQVIFKGRVKDESIDDESYDVQLEDVIEKTLRDIPPNVIQDKVYVTPAQAISYGLGSVVTTITNYAPYDVPIPNFDRPNQTHLGLPIPLVFGKAWVELRHLHHGFWMGTTGFSPIAVPFAYNDESFGVSSGTYNVVRDHFGGEFHTWGTQINSGTGRPVGQFAGWWTDKTRGIVWVFGDGNPKVRWFSQADGYRDDANGQWTGTPAKLISNPSDATRFILMNVLRMDATEVDTLAMDTARTSLATKKVSRAMNERASAFSELGGRASQGGLASNMFSYFFTSNVDGKAKLLAATATGTIQGSYRATGKDANIVRGSFKSRSQASRIITRAEVESGYNVASATDKSFVHVIDHTAEAFSGGNTIEPIRIKGNWVPVDAHALTLRYLGTSLIATAILLGEGADTEQKFRFTSPIAGETFSVDLNEASANTVSKFKNILDAKSFLVATLSPLIISSLSSKGLRSFGVLTGGVRATGYRMKLGYGKLLAWEYLDRYDHNRNLYTWKSPWVGYEQEIGEYVDVRSLGDTSTREVQILETRKDPLGGTVDFLAEETG